MKHYEELLNTLSTYNIETVKNHKGVEYLNIEAAFDIESTSTKIDGEPIAFMYIWQLGIGYGNVYYGRTWEEFIVCINAISKHFDLNVKRRLRIYVHNLGYEFQFIHKYFNWCADDMFHVDKHKPITVLSDIGIEFRDSLILSGSSLAVTANNLSHFNIRKLTGDLDYQLIRTHETPLTSQEMAYCENDVLIILAYISEQIQLYGDLTRVPLTNTQRVRRFVHDECYGKNIIDKDERTKQAYKYRKMIKGNLVMDVPTYNIMKKAFSGGFVNVNATYANTVVNDVSSYDLNSSYPAVMITEKFPMSKFKLSTNKSWSMRQLKGICKHKAVVFDVEFLDLKPRITQEFFLSAEKCNSTGKLSVSNGRVVSADRISTTTTNIDFEIIEQCYEWSGLAITNVYTATLGYLPPQIIKSILKLYQDKTQLKGVVGKEVEYNISKGMLNSVYGMSVTDIVQDLAVYNNDGEWNEIEPMIDEAIDGDNKSFSRFLYYPWGVFITAYARRNLWSAILAIGDDYVYSDTDCVKFLNVNRHKPYFEWFNKSVELKAELMCCYYGINPNVLRPKAKCGTTRVLGVWDYEGIYTKFKAVSAKRYMYESDNKLTLVVSSLNKHSALQYMLDSCDNNHDDVFDMFSYDMVIPASHSGKTIQRVIDTPRTVMITDYMGNETQVTTLSGIYIENCDYTLRVDTKIIDMLNTIVH